MKINIKKLGKSFVFLIIIAFLGLFYAYSTGYYEKQASDKINLTNEMIERFENDLANGEDISLGDYLIEEKNYATKTSSASLKISNKLENIIDNGIKFIFRKLGSMVE